jgi:hypothetical protein
MDFDISEGIGIVIFIVFRDELEVGIGENPVYPTTAFSRLLPVVRSLTKWNRNYNSIPLLKLKIATKFRAG